MKPSARRALRVLQAANGAWVSGRDLAEVAGFRFGGRLQDLRDAGWTIESRPPQMTKGSVWEYRLPAPEKAHKRPAVAPGQMQLMRGIR